jgi:predicted nucleic acid-binding protein
MNGMPVSPDEAVKAWHQLSEDPRAVYIDAEPAGHESRFVRLVSSRVPIPNLWTDAWLAALAMSLDCEIATFDRGFRSFRELKLQLLTIPDS